MLQSNYVLKIVCVTLLFTATALSVDKIEFEMLKIHNIYRLLHSANNLYLDKNMSLLAKNVAKSLMREGTPVPDYENYGMNIYRISRDEVNKSVEKIVQAANKSWFDEGYTYDFSKEPSNMDPTKSFTQIVWKNTEHIGTAISRNSVSGVVVVLYSTKGNQQGQFIQNVGKPIYLINHE